MKAYSYKWIVRINAGYFMAGIHRFKTKKAALKFMKAWKAARVPGSTSAQDAISEPYKSPEVQYTHDD
jgi:hypothetical protein